MNPRNCEPCSTELNQYEGDWVGALIKWLEAVTCVRWIVAYPDSAVLDKNETGLENAQHGILNIERITPNSHTRLSDESTKTENEHCIVVQNTIDIDAELTVYHHHEMPCENGTAQRTTGDLLLRVFDAHQGIKRLRKLLTDEEISITSFGSIVNTPEQGDSGYIRKSTQQIDISVNRRTSFAEDLIIDVGLAFCCNDDEEKIEWH